MKNCMMKSYLGLIPISAKARRKQNRLTLICIILAVFLVTSIFSMVEIISKGQEESTIRRHGNYHIILNGISEEEADEIAGREDIAAAAWYRAAGEDSEKWRYTVNDQRVIVYGAEQSYLDDIRNFEQEGIYPRNGSEVMLSMDAKESFGFQEGDSITIHTPAGDFEYSVSGFCMDDTAYNEDISGFCVYMSIDEAGRICAANQEEGEPGYYIQFAQKTKLKNAVDDLKAQYNLSDGNIKENLILLGLEGVSNNQKVNALYPTALVIFGMILIAGVLMISSCMNSNVAQRTKFFGMMRCIGASKQQVMRFVRLEALNWCKISIPIGLALGIAVTWIMCTFLQNVIGGEFTDYPFRFSAFGVVGGVLVGIVTVLLAAHAPAKRAAKVSPVAAVSGNDETGKSISHAANTRIFKVESALGIYHAVSAKKNLILVSLSFAFTVILFLTFAACLDIIKRLVPSTSNFSPDISIVSASNTNSMEKSLADEISELPGVEIAFGNMMSYDVAAEINGNAGRVDLISYDERMFSWSKKSVVSGDLSKITEGSDYVMTIFAQNSSLNTGDKIKIGDTELEIACVVSEGIGSSGKRPTVVCTEEAFTRITGEKDYLLLNAQFTKDITEETVDEIRLLAGENDFEDRREEDLMVYSSFWVFRTAIYGFLAIISLITVINIMNSISMSVSARIKQYGAMRAVGMSVHQMTKMITAEAVTYAVCGLFIGCAVGLYFHRLIFVKIITTHFGGNWKLPMEPILIVTAIFAMACAAAVYAPAKRIRDMAITDTINEL
ncbi:MAG: ABC transporter permease [Lachnospiraceae bacterium]|nr:ABC transporter permease [Lachnospiraceae bacterium]